MGVTTTEESAWRTVPRPRLEHRRQIPALTGLRFFAAFFILFAHAGDWIAQFSDSHINIYFSFVSMYGMTLFFVLSGFVINYNYRDLYLRTGIARATCEFAAARFARLYPLYLCFLLLALGADEFFPLAYNAPDMAGPILAYYATLTQTWWYVIYHGELIIHLLFPVSWSISTEMYFYFLYAILVFALIGLSRLRRTILIGTIYAATAIAVLWFLLSNVGIAEHYIPDYIPDANFEHSFSRWLFYFSPYVRVLEFFLGCFAAQAFIERVDRPVSQLEHHLGSVALCLALGFLVFAALLDLSVFNLPTLNAYARFFANNFLCAPAAAVIMFCVARYDTPFTRLMSAPVLVGLGEMSYSIYLVHSWTLRLFQHPPLQLTPWTGAWAALRVVLAIAFTLLTSYATYRLIELKGRILLRGALRRCIARVFGDTSGAFSGTPAGGRVIWTITGSLFAVLLAVGGQAARSDLVYDQMHRLILGERPEVRIVSATYGGNCQGFTVRPSLQNRAWLGNATQQVRDVCHDALTCDFEVLASRFGDPVPECGKDFVVQYRCAGHAEVLSTQIPGEALGKHVALSCQHAAP